MLLGADSTHYEILLSRLTEFPHANCIAIACQHMGDVLHSIVDFGYARYQGNMNKATGNIELLGVPYAAAPTGTPPPGLLRPLTNRVFTGDAQMEGASTA